MKKGRVAVLDYGLGNIRSIQNALKKLGGHPILTRDAEEINQAGSLIIPGVGAFQSGMEHIHAYGLQDVIRGFVDTGKPVLGICLGMQLLLEESEENGWCAGLGFIPGQVVEMPLSRTQKFRLPHVSWNTLTIPKEGAWNNGLLKSVSEQSYFYFVHSYVVRPDSRDHVYSLTQYGDCEFVSGVRRDNVFGFQFHPERSGEVGLKVLQDFLSLCD